jgi:hypothetical protein
MGIAISPKAPDSLLMAIEQPIGSTWKGQVWSVGLTRDLCHHVSGFAAPAVAAVETPNISRLVAGPHGVVFYLTEDNALVHHLNEVLPSQSSSAYSVDLKTLGVGSNEGAYAANGTTYTATGATSIEKLPINLLSLAYVPKGSPGFTSDGLLLQSGGGMEIWDVDPSGDPQPSSTRQSFASPSGGYFGMVIDPVAGDLLVGVGDAAHFQVVIVRGFVPPPPIDPPR